ncbi:tetratricopeptide repeat protein [bacterium]|nr:tetratricopeptide repeat protein [bacterium]
MKLTFRARALGWVLLTAVGFAGLTGCAADRQRIYEERRTLAFDLFTEGQDLEAVGEYTAAQEKYLAALELSPRPAFYYKVGHSYNLLGEPERAMIYFDKALEVAPDYEQAEAERELARLQLIEKGLLAREDQPPSLKLPIDEEPVVAEATPEPTPTPIKRPTIESSRRTPAPTPTPEPTEIARPKPVKTPAVESTPVVEETPIEVAEVPATPSNRDDQTEEQMTLRPTQEKTPAPTPTPRPRVESTPMAPPPPTFDEDEAREMPKSSPEDRPSDAAREAVMEGMKDEPRPTATPVPTPEATPEKTPEPTPEATLAKDENPPEAETGTRSGAGDIGSSLASLIQGGDSPVGQRAESLDPEEVRAAVFPELTGEQVHDVESLREAGLLAAEQGRWSDAVLAWSQVANMEPENAEAHLYLAESLAKTTRTRRALEEYRRAADLDPNNADIYLKWGNVLARIGRELAAEGRYRDAMGVDPNDPRAQNNIGALFLRQKAYGRALDELRPLVESHPEFAPAHLNLALAIDGSHGDLDEAIEELETYLRLGGVREAEVESWLVEMRSRQ